MRAERAFLRTLFLEIWDSQKNQVGRGIPGPGIPGFLVGLLGLWGGGWGGGGGGGRGVPPRRQRCHMAKCVYQTSEILACATKCVYQTSEILARAAKCVYRTSGILARMARRGVLVFGKSLKMHKRSAHEARQGNVYYRIP